VDAQLQREIIDYLIQNGTFVTFALWKKSEPKLNRADVPGSAAFDPPLTKTNPTPSAALIYWRRPEEWGELIYAWVNLSWFQPKVESREKLTMEHVGDGPRVDRFHHDVL